MEHPGVNRKDIEISASKNWLTIKGKIDLRQDDEGPIILRKVRASGVFERSIELPFQIEAKNVDTEFKNGVLKMAMPKAKEARRRLIIIKNK